MNKVLLITGASSGIGAETARHAVAAGFRVGLAARSGDKLATLVDELGGTDKALALSCDVQQPGEQQAMVEQLVSHFGQLDAVLANAGRGGTPGGFSSADPAQWQDMLMTNVLGTALSVQCCLPHLRQSRGHVLLMGSVAGRVTIAGSMYGVSKWAVTAMGYALREELSGSGIRVTLVEPGMVDTPLFDNKPPSALQPEDIARAIVYALQQPAHVDVNEIMVRPTPPLDASGQSHTRASSQNPA
jgi:NADP-dependent 3-hydroxy acid dehydrogenase YdfG